MRRKGISSVNSSSSEKSSKQASKGLPRFSEKEEAQLYELTLFYRNLTYPTFLILNLIY